MAYQVFFEVGMFNTQAGAERLAELLNAYAQNGNREIVSVMPITRDGNTTGVQIITCPKRKQVSE